MKTFEQNSIRMGRSHDGIVKGMVSAFRNGRGETAIARSFIRCQAKPERDEMV
jgi:hypothetical protein